MIDDANLRRTLWLTRVWLVGENPSSKTRLDPGRKLAVQLRDHFSLFLKIKASTVEFV
jgi:hypothetical protein